MSPSSQPPLRGVAESLLVPLYLRARETQRPDALLKDEKALELAQKLELDPARFSQAQVSEEVSVSILLRNRHFDRIAREFLAVIPDAVVVHLGCGLDARFERVDNGKVVWYDLDLPEVIALRRELLGGEVGRYHLLACSALDPTWMEAVIVHRHRTFLFLAEGVFMFFNEAQVKYLVLRIKRSFPGSELVFDAFSPFYVWANNRRVKRTNIGATANWALKSARDLEGWASGIRLLDEWYPFLTSEPRLGNARWVRFIPLLTRVTGIFHYRLG